MNEKDSYTAVIDLKPALDEGKLDQRLLRDFEKFQNRDFENALVELLPKSMIPVVIRRSGIPPEEKVHSITREQRRALLETIKHFAVEIACKAPVEDAIVTSGGVKVSHHPHVIADGAVDRARVDMQNVQFLGDGLGERTLTRAAGAVNGNGKMLFHLFNSSLLQ